MKRKLQVFISSTYLDMRDERQAVVEAVLQAGHIPAGMELFAANDESQWETIKRWIDDSDVYMLILGGRYGTIEKNSGKSYIELEYDYATEKSKPKFSAVIKESYLEEKVKDKGTAVMELDNSHLLKQFRTKATSKTTRFFTDLNELKLTVFQSLGIFNEDSSLSGWVPGSEVVNPKPLLDEIQQLREVNHKLNELVTNTDLDDFSLSSMQIQKMEIVAKQLNKLIAKILVTSEITGCFYKSTKRLLVADFYSHPNPYLEFVTENLRDEAEWNHTIQALVSNGFVVPKKQIDCTSYNLTYLGYKLVDLLKLI